MFVSCVEGAREDLELFVTFVVLGVVARLPMGLGIACEALAFALLMLGLAIAFARAFS